MGFGQQEDRMDLRVAFVTREALVARSTTSDELRLSEALLP